MDNRDTLDGNAHAPLHGTPGRMRSVDELKAAIDGSMEAENAPKRQIRLRASSIGKECARSLVYDFWWATDPPPTAGRVLRIFRTGQRIEDEVIADLKRGGFEVINRDPDNPQKQISVSALFGHMFGYVDGIGRDRTGGGDWLVIEVKSHNKKNFDKLEKSQSVEAVKPEHAAQLTIYMKLTGINRGLYVARCKDDERDYMEPMTLNESYAIRLIERALAVLDRNILPPKIGPNAQYYKCRSCSHADVCHNNVPPSRNCRTCEFAKAIDGGEFGCSKHACTIEKALAETGCADYVLAEVFKPAV